MEFIITRLNICFVVITYILLEHAVTSDRQSYYIECMRNLEPHCCQEPCKWNPEDKRDAECTVHENYMECIYGETKKNFTIPSISTGKVKQHASCKIRKQGKDCNVSCHKDEKPICCDTKCKWDLNLLKCQIKGECKACNVKIDDECYIYTDPMDAGVTAKQEMNTSSCNTTVQKWICETNYYILCIAICITICIGICIGIGMSKCSYCSKKTEAEVNSEMRVNEAESFSEASENEQETVSLGLLGQNQDETQENQTSQKTEDMRGTNQTTTKNKEKKRYRGNGQKSKKKKHDKI